MIGLTGSFDGSEESTGGGRPVPGGVSVRSGMGGCGSLEGTGGICSPGSGGGGTFKSGCPSGNGGVGMNCGSSWRVPGLRGFCGGGPGPNGGSRWRGGTNGAVSVGVAVS